MSMAVVYLLSRFSLTNKKSVKKLVEGDTYYKAGVVRTSFNKFCFSELIMLVGR